MARRRKHPLQPVQGEGRGRQGPDRKGQELEGIIVGGDAVGMQDAAPAAPVDDGPFPIPAHPYPDGLHDAPAEGGAVAGGIVQVKAA